MIPNTKWPTFFQLLSICQVINVSWVLMGGYGDKLDGRPKLNVAVVGFGYLYLAKDPLQSKIRHSVMQLFS